MFIVVDRRQDNPGLCQHIIRSTDMAHINRNGFFVINAGVILKLVINYPIKKTV